jgi:hypothetical protein
VASQRRRKSSVLFEHHTMHATRLCPVLADAVTAGTLVSFGF